MDDGIERLERERAVTAAFEADRPRSSRQLTPRQRIAALVDDGSFLELGTLTRSQHVELADATPGDGLVAGWATVGGREIAVLAEDPLVLARTDGQVAKQKRRRLLVGSAARGTPAVYLADGPRTGLASFAPATGDLFGFMAKQSPEPPASELAAPFVVGAFGPCFGRAAELAVGADLVVASPSGAIGLAPSAPVTLGEEHHRRGSLVDCAAADEVGVLATIRMVLLTAPTSRPDSTSRRSLKSPTAGLTDDLATNPLVGDLVSGLFDAGTVVSFRTERHFVSGIAALEGHQVVFAATGEPGEGVLDTADIRAIGRIARLSRRLELPLLFVQHTAGYKPAALADPVFLTELGQALEEIRTTWAPKLCLVAGHGHVLGTFVLGGRQLGTDYIVALPGARIAAVDVPAFYPGALPAAAAGPWVAAGLGHVDEVVAPSEARRQLATFIEILEHGRGLPPPEIDRRGRFPDEISKV